MKTETLHPAVRFALEGRANTFKVGAGDKFIDYIEVYDQSGNGKFDLVSISALSDIGTTDLEFDVLGRTLTAIQRLPPLAWMLPEVR